MSSYPAAKIGDKAILDHAGLQNLIDVLIGSGYRVVGPTVRDQAIVYEEISSLKELPEGWTDEQDGGHYRLKRRSDKALFGFVVGPHTWKQFLYPPRQKLWEATRDGNNFEVIPSQEHAPRYALFGARSCELHAIAVQDRVFLEGPYTDPVYKARREQAFIVAVNCTQAGNTCFCVSMNTGPKATAGFDLALTEVIAEGRHYFLLEAGSAPGLEIFLKIGGTPAGEEERVAAQSAVDHAAGQMGRRLDTTNLRDLLQNNLEHPRWDTVATRCLTCANCTLVCPTCFCSEVEDLTDLSGDHAERWRRWDSCFTLDFTKLHGGHVRQSTRSRYRQWLTHKLSTWHDQFGTSGCVGCGRCITWCPVGIDLTEEVEAIRNNDKPATT